MFSASEPETKTLALLSTGLPARPLCGLRGLTGSVGTTGVRVPRSGRSLVCWQSRAAWQGSGKIGRVHFYDIDNNNITNSNGSDYSSFFFFFF